MIVLDAQFSPALVPWIVQTFAVEAKAVRDLGLRDAEDDAIFEAAKKLNAIVMTKDTDFVDMVERFGPPPQILLLTCGNTSNAHLRAILAHALPDALALLAGGEPLVEIGDA